MEKEKIQLFNSKINLVQLKNKLKLSKSLDDLGFFELEIYEFDSSIPFEMLSSERILSEILNSSIYFKQEYIIDYEKGGRKIGYRVRGPILDTILASNFERLNFENLKLKIKDFRGNEDWGEDLPIFEQLIDETFSYIITHGFDQDQIYYLNKDTLSEETKVEFDDYAYYLSIIIISTKKREVLLITHGGD